MLIVDDHPLTRDGLAALLAGNGFDIVGEAGGGSEALALARALREAGARVMLYPQADKLQKQFAYADAQKIALVALVGEDERNSGTVVLKHMRSRQQESISRELIADAIKQELGEQT